MNVLLIMVGLRAWRGSPLQIVTRVFAAISLVSLEIQAVTWLGIGTFRSLIVPNAVAAVLFFWWMSRSPSRESDDTGPRGYPRYILPAAVALGSVVLYLNNVLPLTPVDPYHLERMARIERSGTIAYDPSVDRNDPRLNALNWLYEFLLVDVQHIPLVGERAVRNHGILGLLLYTVTAWAMLIMLKAPPGWPAVMLFSVPLVFHQLVLVKNDLIGALPAALVLTWTVSRLRMAPVREFLWAGWLAGIAVSIKLTSFPVALVLVAASLLWRREARAFGWMVAGGIAGALAGGFVYTLIENARMYGSAVGPFLAITGRPVDAADSAVSLLRFAISLFDLGVLTRALWPQAGGWGGTYGLPLIWALAVVVVNVRRAPQAREALGWALVFWILCASTNIDMGTNHRYVLAPGLLLVAVAVSLAPASDRTPAWVKRSAVAVIVLSALQILRSASLYLIRL